MMDANKIEVRTMNSATSWLLSLDEVDVFRAVCSFVRSLLTFIVSADRSGKQMPLQLDGDFWRQGLQWASLMFFRGEDTADCLSNFRFVVKQKSHAFCNS